MDQYEQKLRQFLQESQAEAEHLQFDQSCHSVEDAAKAANTSINALVKNICFIDPQDNLIVAIVKGEDRVSTTRVAKSLGVAEVRVATPEEILLRTGYPCGGTPSFGFVATFLIDPKVLETEVVYTGGGSDQSLTKVASQELQRMNQGQIVRIRR